MILGGVFHLFNANSFFGFTKRNPFGTPNRYALLILFGYVLFIVLAHAVI